MQTLSENIDDSHIITIKNIENKIYHDVKSIEYFLAQQLKKEGFEKYINLLHFGLTSQDTNTIAYSKSLVDFNTNIFHDLFFSLLFH